MIYKNLGVRDGIPRFREEAWAVNDFPNAEERSNRRGTQLNDKTFREQRIVYMAAGPTCDYNRDGKLDIFLASWWNESHSLLLRNETPGGNWPDVRVEGRDGVNRMGIGAKVNVYPAGKLGEASALLGSREIGIGYGYCSGQEAVAHFGLGAAEAVDLRVVLPHGKGEVVRKNVRANQRLTVK